MFNLDDPVEVLKGIGANTKQTFNKKGIFTLRDMLYYLPVGFKDFSHPSLVNKTACGENHIFKILPHTKVTGSLIRKNLSVYNFIGSDASGAVRITFFNQGYLSKKIQPNTDVYIYGKVKTDGYGQKFLAAQDFYFAPPKDGYLPIYSVFKGITQNVFRKYISQILNNTDLSPDYSISFQEKFDLMSLNEAFWTLHFPKDEQYFLKARLRIVFDELLVFFRMLDFLNTKKLNYSNKKIRYTQRTLNDFIQLLPFNLTKAQLNVMNEIAKNFESDYFMNRLIQGDVGSGKTIIAFYSMYAMGMSGYQSALMAPTEVLARQHYYNAVKILGNNKTVLLTGSTTAKEKREIIKKIENGEALYIIGTHALLYGDINFKNLGLLVTDEQHRFGVKQRALLSKKAMDKIHVLNLTATPIPRSLALTVYGNTEISIVKEMPPGRIPIKTYLIPQNKRNTMFGFINDEIRNGRQAYFVCPLIEDLNNNMEDTQSAVQMFEEIKRNFSSSTAALLHGRMKASEKNKIMEDFALGKIDVLVSTTVIEVGVDVPNATVMAVQNAERFGMAQLHQLRGRVGRGKEQSYCFLISDNEGALKRLRFMTQTADGFEIAKKDMQMRGTGEFWGFKQHGDPALKNADLFKDYNEVVKARQALDIMKKDEKFYFEYDLLNKKAIKMIKGLNENIIMN